MIRHNLKSFDSEKINLLLAWAVALAAIAFITYHAMVIFGSSYPWIERLMAGALLGVEILFAVTSIGYGLSVAKSRSHDRSDTRFVPLGSHSSVACLITVCDEPLDVVAETIASVCGLWYPNKTVYVLDDSSKPENIKNIEILAKDFGVSVIKRPDRRHFKAGNLNHALARIKEDYIAVFDADQRPQPSFLSDIVPLLDENPDVAFVQTPQAYSNISTDIAAAAALQSSMFYGYIAEGKDVSGAMFCCGTNFVMRRRALETIGGFDVGSVTEDFATTLKLHAAGWRTSFYSSLYVLGLGPETLASYLKQYSRWATGTLQVFASALKLLVKNPRALSPAQWFEYWLCFSYYLSGPANFYLLFLPSAYLFLGLRPIRGNPFAYLTLFLGVVFFSWALFLFSSHRRGYSVKSLITVCARLDICKFYIYTKALLSVVCGRPATFKVTEKGGSKQMPWRYLAVPLSVLGLNALAVMVGLIYMSMSVEWYAGINTFWAAYNVWMFSALIQYNLDGPKRSTESFQVWESEAKA